MKNRSVYHLAFSSLQWLLAGLFLAALPLWFQLSPVVLTAFLGCLAWRWFLERNGLRCPSIWVRILVALAGLGLLFLLHGTLLGLTAGMGLLLLLLGLKALEMRSRREFLLLSFLGFFINLTALFFAQSLLVCLYVAAVFVVLLAGVIHFNSGASRGYRFWPLVRYALVLLLQAAPLIVVLFFLLPRMRGGFSLRLNQSNLAQTGMSDHIRPGSFAGMAMSEEVAFRADFPEGNMPPLGDLYWRVVVLTEGDGLSWQRSRVRGDLAAPELSGARLVQRISMEPHGARWVYALDRPERADVLTQFEEGHCLALRRETRDRLPPLRVVSRLGNDRTPLTPEARRRLIALPENISERTRQLVTGWLVQSAEPREIARMMLAYFRTERFRYTLTPGIYSGNGLDDFLFNRRLGFCEHYATAFATLMRLAGIPSRVVAGYHGGEYNPFGSHLVIRQSNAHAWAEIWVHGEGWVRMDPTEAIDPARVDPNTQLASRQSGGGAMVTGGTGGRGAGWMPDAWLRTMGQAWDAVNYEWNLWVLGYDFNMQRDFYLHLGITHWFSWRLLAFLGGGLLFAVLLVRAALWQRRPPVDPVLEIYRNHCQTFARAGVPRRLNEGPLEYSARLTGAFPQCSSAIAASFALFIGMRYHSVRDKATVQRFRENCRQLRHAIRSLS